MNDPLLDRDDAATPLTADERADLIPAYISLRSELNGAEQANILDAELWAFRRKRDVLNERFLTTLHKRMFSGVWKWAGEFRRTDRNIGVDPYRIAMDLAHLLDDANFWLANGTFDTDEVAVRFHHRLVWIHPFPSGNGRHARLATDLLLVKRGRPRFTWGSANLVDAGLTRRQYIDALRTADRHDIEPLKRFVRS